MPHIESPPPIIPEVPPPRPLEEAMSTLFFQLFLLLLLLYTNLYFFELYGLNVTRSKIFNPKFMAQFNKEHLEAFGTKPAVDGYPDYGNGYYA